MGTAARDSSRDSPVAYIKRKNMVLSYTLVTLALVGAVFAADASSNPWDSLDGKTYTTRYSGAKAQRAITQEEKEACHNGVRGPHGRLCNAYAQPVEEPTHLGFTATASNGSYGWLADECFQKASADGKTVTGLTWAGVNKGDKFGNQYSPLASSKVWTDGDTNGTVGAWGNCVVHRQDKDANGYRYIYSNNVPDYYFNPYCPFSIGQGYCIKGEPCPFPTLECGTTTSYGYTPYGDVWVPQVNWLKIPLIGNPARQSPGDMYGSVDEGYHNIGPAVGVALNGVVIQGPNDAGAVNVDEAGFQLMCGGHVTPPVSAYPQYHYHKPADCTPPFKEQAIPVSHGGVPHQHGGLYGYANDGFGIYTYADVGGAAPVLDECNGHFGPVSDNSTEVVYHYHATTTTPYHLACQGPALGQCESTQGQGTSFCGKGCGAEVCVQPGSERASLEKYMNKFNSTWLQSYSVNKFEEKAPAAALPQVLPL